MSRTVQFTFDTEKEKELFIEYAKRKGWTLPVLCKTALVAYIKRHRDKNIEALYEKYGK